MKLFTQYLKETKIADELTEEELKIEEANAKIAEAKKVKEEDESEEKEKDELDEEDEDEDDLDEKLVKKTDVSKGVEVVNGKTIHKGRVPKIKFGAKGKPGKLSKGATEDPRIGADD